MYTFAREYLHPRDREKMTTSDAVARFRSDQQRFSAPAYEKSNLLWRGEQWRVPSANERLEVHRALAPF